MKVKHSCCAGCKYVTYSPINDGRKYCGIEISLSSEGSLRCRNFDSNDNLIGQEIININFCPICGRRLK